MHQKMHVIKMAHVFTSISSKIFGFSVVLLILMVGTSVWSASANKEVHRSLQTLELSMFPLTTTVARINLIVQAQKTTSDYLTVTPDAKAVKRCTTQATLQATSLQNLIDKANQYRAIGSSIASTERVKLAMARFEVLIGNIDYQSKRLAKMTLAACPLDADDVRMSEAREQAAELERLSTVLDDEISSFVETSSRLIAENQQRAERANIIMICTAAMVGMMLAWLVSRGLTRPILRLLVGARAVGAGLLDQAHVPVTSRDEIGDVTHAFNAMIVELRDKERIKETFGQYVDPRVVADLLNGAQRSSGGEKQIATLFFSDIIGFSAVAERLAPSTLVDLVNAYFAEMSQPIRDHSGIIDKYIGDAIMAFWVPPFVDPAQQAVLACKAALEQYALLDAFRARVPDVIGLRRDIPLIDFRVGLSTGEVVVGSIGSNTAKSFTVMGDTVNQASRLEAVNKVYGTHLLIDHDTFSLAGASIAVREIDTITVMGRLEPFRIYELAAMSGDLPAERHQMFEHYRNGLEQYRKANWNTAESALRAALDLEPDDGPSVTLLARIESFRQAPPENWDGIWHMTTK